MSIEALAIEITSISFSVCPQELKITFLIQKTVPKRLSKMLLPTLENFSMNNVDLFDLLSLKDCLHSHFVFTAQKFLSK